MIEIINDRVPLNIACAYDLGFNVPGIKTLHFLEEELNFYEYVYLDDYTVMKNIEGDRLKVMWFYDGSRFTNKVSILYDDRALAGSMGEVQPSNIFTMFKDFKEILGPQFLKFKNTKLANSEYKGWVCFDVTVTDRIYYRNIHLGLIEGFLEGLRALYENSMDVESVQEPAVNFVSMCKIQTLSTMDSKMAVEQFGLSSFLIESPEHYWIQGSGKTVNLSWESAYDTVPKHFTNYPVFYRPDGKKLVETFKSLKLKCAI